MKAKWMGAVGISIVLLSCGSDEADSGGGDSGLGGGGAPAGGAPGTGGTPGGGDFPAFGYTPAGSPCGLPVGSRYLAELRPTAADGYSEPVAWLISGEDGVVVGRGGETFRFPRSGGEVQASTSPGGRVWLATPDSLLVATASGLSLKAPDGDTWRELSVFPFPPGYGPDSPFDGRLALSPDGSAVAYRISPLGLGTHTYGVLEAGQAQARTLAADVGIGSFTPVIADTTHLWSAAGPINEESPMVISLNGGEPEVRSDLKGVPVGIDSTWLYLVRASSDRLEELGFWRAPIRGGAAPERLNDDFTVLSGFRRTPDHTVAWSTSAIYTLDAAGLTEVASIPVRSALDASCTAHGFSVYAGQVFSTIYDEARGGSLLYAVTLP